MEKEKENIYMISYWFKETKFGIFTTHGVGRFEVSGSLIETIEDIELIEKQLMENFKYKKVVTINCVKLS